MNKLFVALILNSIYYYLGDKKANFVRLCRNKMNFVRLCNWLYDFEMDWCLAKTNLAACQVDLLLLISWKPPTGWHQLYDLAPKDGVLLELSRKEGHLSRTNDHLSWTSESPPASILISSRQPMTHRLRNHSMSIGTNYKVHTLFIAGTLPIGNKLQSPLFWKIPYHSSQADDSSIAKSLYVKRYKLQSPHTLHRWYASSWVQTTKSIVLEHSLSAADRWWLIDCEITLCQKVQTTKSTHSSSLVRFQLGTNYKVHCSRTFLISCRQMMTHRLRNHSMPAQ
jgi:hypothetical protein